MHHLGFISLVGFLLTTVPVIADPEFTPATFQIHNPLEKYLSFPTEHSGDIKIRVNCNLYVDKSGKVHKNFCWSFQEDISRPFIRIVSRANKRISIKAAELDGKKQRVYFQYSVLFEQSDGKQKISVYPNHGYDIETLGMDYYGPQRYSGHRYLTLRGCLSLAPNTWVGLEIDEKGMPAKIEILSKVNSEFCANNITKSLSRTRYIPALQNGVPVPSITVFPYLSWWN